MAEIKDNDVRKKWADENTYTEKTPTTSEHTLQPSDHFKTDGFGKPIKGQDNYIGNVQDKYTVRLNESRRTEYNFLVHDKSEHFIRDMNDTQHMDPKAETRPVVVPNSSVINDTMDPRKVVFSGATTNVNPFNDPEMQSIIDYGLSSVVEAKYNESGEYKPPISPMHPFTRMIDLKHQNYHQIANLTTFNRFHIPIADVEHRKAFRHVFFTRPECYVMCAEDGKVRLSQQAEYDEDFNTSYARMPYISKLLSPVYIVGTFGQSKIDKDNFNYLLSNRCMGLSPTGATLSTQDTVGKSIQGYTVTPGMHYEGRQGSTISIIFRDTKYLEIYEYIRMWMLYIWKIKYGIFAPSFNGYKYMNGFPKGTKVEQHMHPFDRALDYTISMFDFVMDESDTFVRYWCKYFGMYPIDLQVEGLSNSNNDALKEEMRVSVTFKYAYKIENTTKTLIEFNYNAGVCDNLGQPMAVANELLHSDQFNYTDSPNGILPHHVGPGAGFVGTPYIVLMNVKKDIFNDTDSHSTISPCLRFSPLIKDRKFDHAINMGYPAVYTNTDFVAQSDVSAAKEAAQATSEKISEQNSSQGSSFWDPTNKLFDKADSVIDYAVTEGSMGDAIHAAGLSGVGKPVIDFISNSVNNGIEDWGDAYSTGVDAGSDWFKNWLDSWGKGSK